MKRIFLILLILNFSYKIYSQESAIFYKIEIYKISQSGKNINVVDLDINSKGKIKNRGKKLKKIIDLKSFDESILKMFTENENVVEIQGEDEKSIQEVLNGQNIYVTVTFLSDYLYENKSEDATHYRYRETHLGVDEKDYAFFKHFSTENIQLLKEVLQ